MFMLGGNPSPSGRLTFMAYVSGGSTMVGVVEGVVLGTSDNSELGLSDAMELIDGVSEGVELGSEV